MSCNCHESIAHAKFSRSIKIKTALGCSRVSKLQAKNVTILLHTISHVKTTQTVFGRRVWEIEHLECWITRLCSIAKADSLNYDVWVMQCKTIVAPNIQQFVCSLWKQLRLDLWLLFAKLTYFRRRWINSQKPRKRLAGHLIQTMSQNDQ